MQDKYIIAIVTFLVTLALGEITKKIPKLSNKIIPIQNLLVGVAVAGIEYAITKDFQTAIALSGLVAGGTYDIIKNLSKLTDENKEGK